MFIWLSQGILLKIGFPLGFSPPRHSSANYMYGESRCTRSLMSMAPSIYPVQPTLSEGSPIGHPWDATPSRAAPAERRFEEQDRCYNIVSSLWRIQCCCCCHMFIAWVLGLCCFHEIYIAAGVGFSFGVFDAVSCYRVNFIVAMVKLLSSGFCHIEWTYLYSMHNGLLRLFLLFCSFHPNFYMYMYL